MNYRRELQYRELTTAVVSGSLWPLKFRPLFMKSLKGIHSQAASCLDLRQYTSSKENILSQLSILQTVGPLEKISPFSQVCTFTRLHIICPMVEFFLVKDLTVFYTLFKENVSPTPTSSTDIREQQSEGVYFASSRLFIGRQQRI